MAVQTGTTSELPIGMQLRVQRTIAGLSVTHIARAVGVSVGHLSRIERGEKKATPELYERIAIAIRASERAA